MGGIWPHGQRRWHAFAAEVGTAWIAWDHAWQVDADVQERSFFSWPAADQHDNFADEPPLSPEEEEALYWGTAVPEGRLF